MDDEVVKGVVVNVLGRKGSEVHFLYLQRCGGAYEGQWWPVAGHCDESETPVEAALRELEEETGLVATSLYDLDKDVMHVDRNTRLKGFVAFVDTTQQIKLNSEHSRYEWLTTEQAYELLPLLVHPFIKHIDETFVAVDEIQNRCLWLHCKLLRAACEDARA